MRVRRRFQVIRDSDGQTLVRAEVDYACIELSSGRPARWPAEFHAGYAILPDIGAAAAAFLGHGAPDVVEAAFAAVAIGVHATQLRCERHKRLRRGGAVAFVRADQLDQPPEATEERRLRRHQVDQDVVVRQRVAIPVDDNGRLGGEPAAAIP